MVACRRLRQATSASCYDCCYAAESAACASWRRGWSALANFRAAKERRARAGLAPSAGEHGRAQHGAATPVLAH